MPLPTAASLVGTVPTDAEFEAYYQRLTASTPHPVAVRPTRHGKGLIVTRAVAAGEVVLVDRPLVALQAAASRAVALACARCCAYLASPGGQLAHGLLSRGADCGEGDWLRLAAGERGAGAGPPLASGSGRDPPPSLPAPHPCAGGCSDDLYCSPECATADWEGGHALLCGGESPDTPLAAAVADLRDHADASNDALLLAARAAAGVAAAAGGDPARLPAAWLPWAVAEKAMWWDVPAWPPVGEGAADAGGGGEAAFRASLRALARGAADRLRAVLAITAPRVADVLGDERVVGALVGAFELNNLEIDVPPLATALAPLPAPDPAYAALLAAAGGADALAAVAARGSAFHPLQSTANHSCAPTARAVPGGGTRGLPAGGAGGATLALPADADAACAVLVAAVDMAPGDEVTLCYVDEGASLAERAAALRDYGIAACDCARCEAERTAAGGAPAPPRRPARSSRGRSSSADDGGGAPAAKRRRRESAWLGVWRAAG